jgi:hypothetical protein
VALVGVVDVGVAGGVCVGDVAAATATAGVDVDAAGGTARAASAL